MSHWILPESGIPASVTTVQRVTNLEKQTDEAKERMDDFQQSAESTWDTRTSKIELSQDDQQNILSLGNEDDELVEEFRRVIKSECLPDANIKTIGLDPWSNVEAGINTEEHGLRRGKVKKRTVERFHD